MENILIYMVIFLVSFNFLHGGWKIYRFGSEALGVHQGFAALFEVTIILIGEVLMGTGVIGMITLFIVMIRDFRIIPN